MNLAEQLKTERLNSYIRLRGGFPIPLAGMVYWLVLAFLGTKFSPQTWSLLAFILSGSIFPLALLFAKLFRNPFIKDRTAVTDVLVPAFASMLLFWPMAIAAMWHFNEMVPLILAIGMSIHWPVIGWSYCRTAPYIAHAIVRALVAFGIWQWLPEARFTGLPLSVAVIYLLTSLYIYIDSGRLGQSGINGKT